MVDKKAKTTILCVDDEQDILDSLHDTLMDTYNVRTAGKASDALRILGEEEISVVISDQRMPVMTGSELLAEINKIKPQIKKILLTGYSDINAAIDAINKGSVNRYLHKPWDDKALIETIEHLVSSYNDDMFADRMLAESKNIKAKIEQWKHHVESSDRFLDSCKMSICVLDKAEKIEYINKKGLEILKHSSVNDVKGRPVNDVFMVDDTSKKTFQALYEQGVVYNLLQARRSDGTTVQLQASLTFSEGSVSGVFFNMPSGLL
ncbi:response regulator receiver protein [Candidatus Magnetobacterium bavaricum]|uniref:Response regulator receiver protein n=1 Tax=Candidatus Magnetobacterium bavaricum TaxID=29290 RepID=A0A0F3GUZ7_9BACT|nr:response regulator receiver protein [Candidatus Magnetobacterium bavaricum]